MIEKHTPLRSLLEELRNTPHGAIEGHAKYKVMHLLANCWHELEGAGETAMQARKLDRAEDVSWNPPVLSFAIERHGQPCTARAAPKCTDGRLTCISEPLVVSEEDIASYYRPLRDST